MCQKCLHEKQRRTNWPTREELKKLIREKPFLQIGKIFDVSDNAIRKWCKYYNLPYKSKDIKGYSDKEWKIV